MSPTGKSLICALRVGARDDVIPVAGSRGANMCSCSCCFARFPFCFSGDSCPSLVLPCVLWVLSPTLNPPYQPQAGLIGKYPWPVAMETPYAGGHLDVVHRAAAAAGGGRRPPAAGPYRAQGPGTPAAGGGRRPPPAAAAL